MSEGSPKNSEADRWMDHLSKIYDGRAAEAWFNWIEWLLVTGALYAVAKAASSTLFLVLSYVSAGLVLVYSISRVEDLTKPLARKTLKYSPAKSFFLLAPVAILHVLLFISITRVINTMITDVASK